MRPGLFLLFIASLLIACKRPVQKYEAQLRTTFGIPQQVILSGLTATPTSSGMFGREGLRIVGRFRLAEQQLKEAQSSWLRRPPWQPLPLPDAVSLLRFAPEEVLGDAAGPGFYQCSLGVWRSGQTFDPYPCSTPPSKIDQYRVAVFLPLRGEIIAVMKNYY